VIAAPAIQGVNFTQDYLFHWVRDGAIAMSAVLMLYLHSEQPDEKASLRTSLMNYINFLKICQAQPPLNKLDVLGEPKFNIDGTLWTGAWGRPQDDGPALVAILLIQLMNLFLDEKQEQTTLDSLYHSTKLSLIKSNLEYLAHHWSEDSFGVWEEVSGVHFFHLCVQRRALYDGAQLANRMGDVKAGVYYIEQAKKIEDLLAQHWNDELGYYQETLKQTDYRGGGMNSTIIMGLVYGRMTKAGDAYSLAHMRSLSSAYYLRYCFEGLYQINIKMKATSGNGPLIGRYQNDPYDGDRSICGNPWFITTHNFAEFYYATADALLRAGNIEFSFMGIQFFQQILPELNLNVQTILSHEHDRELFEKLIMALVDAGDKMLLATKTFACTYQDGSTLHMSEQIDRSSGQQKSAMDLTWSYASIISALLTREETLRLWSNF
jgi:glucoamylase